MPNRVNLAVIPDEDSATDRASSIDANAASTLPSTDKARSNSVGIPPSMDAKAAPPDLVSSAGIKPFMDEGAAIDHTSTPTPKANDNASTIAVAAIPLPPSMDGHAAPDGVNSAEIACLFLSSFGVYYY